MLELYGHPFSSYTWKARIALLANDTPHVLKMVDPGHPDNSAFVAAAHPAGKFPVLKDGDTIVVESSAIIEYLAQAHPGDAPLIPADPDDALAARMLDRVFDNYVMAPCTDIVLAHMAGSPDPAVIERATASLLRAYGWLENWLEGNLMPPHFSLASCAAAPSLFYADWVCVIPDACPRLRGLRAELLSYQPVIHCVDEARPYRKLFPPGAPDRD